MGSQGVRHDWMTNAFANIQLAYGIWRKVYFDSVPIILIANGWPMVVAYSKMFISFMQKQCKKPNLNLARNIQGMGLYLSMFLVNIGLIRLPFVSCFLVAQMVKSLPAMQETQVWSLGMEDTLEKGMATHSSILAWRIPWTEESWELQFIGSQKVKHNWVTNTLSLKHKSVINQLQQLAANPINIPSCPLAY